MRSGDISNTIFCWKCFFFHTCVLIFFNDLNCRNNGGIRKICNNNGLRSQDWTVSFFFSKGILFVKWVEFWLFKLYENPKCRKSIKFWAKELTFVRYTMGVGHMVIKTGLMGLILWYRLKHVLKLINSKKSIDIPDTQKIKMCGVYIKMFTFLKQTYPLNFMQSLYIQKLYEVSIFISILNEERFEHQVEATV